MPLCTNRLEGFGPSSSINAPLPTTCFTDVIINPLPVWIYLALLLALLTAHFLRPSSTFNPSTAHLRQPASQRRRCTRLTLATLYYLLILANILMQTLENVRLALLDAGNGLLPFVYAGLLLAALVHFSRGAWGRVPAWVAANCVFWLGMLVVSAVKIAGLAREGNSGVPGVDRVGSKYPLSDQLIDEAVIAAVYAVILVLEVALAMMAAREKRRAAVGEGMVLEEGESEQAVRWTK